MAPASGPSQSAASRRSMSAQSNPSACSGSVPLAVKPMSTIFATESLAGTQSAWASSASMDANCSADRTFINVPSSVAATIGTSASKRVSAGRASPWPSRIACATANASARAWATSPGARLSTASRSEGPVHCATASRCSLLTGRRSRAAILGRRLLLMTQGCYGGMLYRCEPRCQSGSPDASTEASGSETGRSPALQFPLGRERDGAIAPPAGTLHPAPRPDEALTSLSSFAVGECRFWRVVATADSTTRNIRRPSGRCPGSGSVLDGWPWADGPYSQSERQGRT